MYWIASRLAAGFAISAAIATIMAAGMAALSQAAQAQPAPPPPLIIPKVELSEEETPPAPKARPVEKVEVTPPALLQLQQKLRDHPGQRRAGQRVCEAEWSVLLGKSNYLPRLNATLSGGNKWIDQTSGADEFGGSRSTEYDGRGLNATLTLRQHLYDWARTASVINSYRQDRHIAEIERQNTLNEQLAGLLRMALQYVLQVRLVHHFADVKNLTDRDVTSMEQRFKAGAARLASIERRITNLRDKIEILRPLVEGGHEARLTLVEAESEYNGARDEYEAVLANYRAEAARELAEVRTRADQAGAREDAFRAKVRHADVRAPADGTVSAVHVKTVGAVVQAGTVLAEIVPDEKHLLVQARILSEDIGGVHLGQPAQVSLSAYDVSRYGNLEGHVQRIAQNTTQEENFPPYYQTMIAIPEPKLSKSDAPVEIVPGMTVMVDIIGQKRTVLNYIMTPLNRAAGLAFREN
ncbi:MAG: HlyD family efflux transporter periplasmic adaptor subunit [Parvibaculales bacterium]